MATAKTDKVAKTAKPAVKAEKSKKAVEVKTVEQLNEQLATLRADFQESRRSHRMGDIVNPHVLTTQRKEIARTLTALRHAEIASQKEEN